MDAHRDWSPCEVDPASVGTKPSVEGLVEYLGATEEIDDRLIREQALIFRDFNVTEDTLAPVLDLLLPNRLAYVHGNSPRTKVGQNVYTSTEYPPEFTISMHNELSYAHEWPSRLLFFCGQAEMTGGATPVLDAQLWLESIDPEIRDAFSGGVRYTQNLHDGFGLGRSWQDTFETDDRDEVERFLSGTDATWEWKPDGSLRVSQLRPATTTHPVVGNEVWFNQADQWHVATLGDATAQAMAEVLGEDELPQSVSYADGTPIPAEHVTQVRDRGLENAVDVPWHEGDLLLIDNVLVAHGRRPFSGRRRVLVAMSD
jgi:alpha-ketoglutarate-dependent taurine dioxygenase